VPREVQHTLYHSGVAALHSSPPKIHVLLHRPAIKGNMPLCRLQEWTPACGAGAMLCCFNPQFKTQTLGCFLYTPQRHESQQTGGQSSRHAGGQEAVHLDWNITGRHSICVELSLHCCINATRCGGGTCDWLPPSIQHMHLQIQVHIIAAHVSLQPRALHHHLCYRTRHPLLLRC
jgi:hypothetical protein